MFYIKFKCISDYTSLCKEIKTTSSKKLDEYVTNVGFIECSLFQSIKELELVLEIILTLSNVVAKSHEKLFDLMKEFSVKKNKLFF